MTKERAMSSDQWSMSRFVYPTTVGRPVVPEEAWTLTTLLMGTANIRRGSFPSNPASS